MKRIVILLSIAVIAIVAAVATDTPVVPSAEAAPVWKVALSSSDAGATNTATMDKQRTYSVQCASPACVKTATSGTVVPDCAKDYVLPAVLVSAGGAGTITGTTNATDAGIGGSGLTQYTLETSASTASYRYQLEFESAAHSRVAAMALDAGDPACNLIQLTKSL
jgi:hypothetical protein